MSGSGRKPDPTDDASGARLHRRRQTAPPNSRPPNHEASGDKAFELRKPGSKTRCKAAQIGDPSKRAELVPWDSYSEKRQADIRTGTVQIGEHGHVLTDAAARSASSRGDRQGRRRPNRTPSCARRLPAFDSPSAAKRQRVHSGGVFDIAVPIPCGMSARLSAYALCEPVPRPAPRRLLGTAPAPPPSAAATRPARRRCLASQLP